MARKTITSLEAELAKLREASAANYENGKSWKIKADALEETLKKSRTDFADLKVRLHAAESANQQMRGYIQRVQEDDVVREELVTTGDPQGEQRMAPKRKHTEFPRPSDLNSPDAGFGMSPYLDRNDRERNKPKHWITY